MEVLLMNKLPKVGDKIFITMLNEVELEVPHLVTIDRFDDKDEYYAYFSPPIKLNHCGEEKVIDLADGSVDVCEYANEDHVQQEEESVVLNRDVKVGDKIVVTRYNGASCQREAVVTEVYTTLIDVEFCDNGEDVPLYKNPTGIDV